MDLPHDVSALIFDCDGTLVDTPPAYGRAWIAGLQLSGKTVTLDWFRGRAGMSEYVLMDSFEAEHGVTLERDAVVRVMRQTLLEELHTLREIEAVTAIARAQHRRLPMAVASGGSEAIVSATLRATGLRPLFDAVVTIDDVPRAKPAPDLFLEAARRLGAAPGACLVFEDSREGLEAAHRAGMRAIDVTTLIHPG